MIQYGSSLGLALKTGDRLRVMGHVFGQELERDQAAELQVLSFVHDAHTAAAQLLEDPVVRNGLADHWNEILGLEVGQVNEGTNVGCIPTRQVAIGVGIVVAHDPLHGPGRALISASGSYRRCVAAKRASGKGWSARGWGSHRSAKARVRVQEIERR